MSKLAFGTTKYAIWRKQNNRSFSENSMTKEVIISKIYRTSRDKIAFFSRIKSSKESERIAKMWGPSNCIFKSNLEG